MGLVGSRRFLVFQTVCFSRPTFHRVISFNLFIGCLLIIRAGIKWFEKEGQFTQVSIVFFYPLQVPNTIHREKERRERIGGVHERNINNNKCLRYQVNGYWFLFVRDFLNPISLLFIFLSFKIERSRYWVWQEQLSSSRCRPLVMRWCAQIHLALMYFSHNWMVLGLYTLQPIFDWWFLTPLF